MRKLYVRLSDTLLLFCLLATATVWGQTPFQQPDGSWEVILTTTGAGTWTVPANVYEITVEAVGGGGGGARGTSSSTTGGGGGGGAYVKSTICTTPSTSIPYFIGGGGSGAAASGDGSNKNGKDTWFVNSSTVLAKGGVGTTTSAGGTGGTGGASIGDLTIGGESGAAGTTNFSGKGGNAGYTDTVGSIGASGNTGLGGAGVTSGNGIAGTNYGGGGSGGKKGILTPEHNGGAGASGVIRITYYVSGDITSVVANPTYCAGEYNIQLTAVKNSNEGSFSTLWFEGGSPEIHFSNQFVSAPLATNLTNTTVGNSNTEGVLRVTSTTADPYINFDNIPAFNASTTFTHISVRYKYVSGTVSNAPSIIHGATVVNGTTLETTGDWRIATFDISSLDNNITDFELHWASDSGVTLDLDYVVVANQPVIEGIANSYTSVKTQDNTITVNTENPTTYYAVRLIEAHCIANTSVQSIEIGVVSPPITLDYGLGVWNTYVWNAADDDSSAQPWVDNYSGFLVIQNLVDSETPEQLVFTTNWESNQSPSYGANYVGCYVNPNRHSFSTRQTGFACGMYGLLINPEGSQLEFYINNEEVSLNEDDGLYSWSGPLTPEDEVEIRYNKGIGESSFLAFILSQETSPLEGGVINHLSPATICPSDVVVFDASNTTPATGGALDPEDIDSFEYQWEVKFDDGDFEDIVGATDAFYTTTQEEEGTYIYRRKVTDFCGEIEYTNEITIIRAELAPLQGGFINYLPSSVVCEDAEVVFNDIDPVTGGLSNPDVGGAVTYQWQISTDNGATFTDIVGATDEFYMTTETGAGTYVYRREVTDLCDNTAYTNEITVVRTTLDTLDPGQINYTGTTPVCPEQQVIFDNVTPAEVVFTDTDINGSVSYQWQMNYAGGGFVDIVGATEEFYTTTQIEGGTYIYRRMVTDQCGAIAYTNEITITRYNGTPLNAGSINYATTTILCSADAVIFDGSNTTPASGGVTEVSSSLVYQWEVNYNDGGFEDIAGATTEFYTTTDTAAGTYIYRRKVTDVACENSVWTNEVTIIRSDSNTLNGGEITYTAPSTLCTPVTAVVFDESNTTPATGGGSSPDVEESLDYQWEVNYNDTGFVEIIGADEEFYTTTQEEEGTYIYRRKVTDWCENVSYTNEVTIIRSELDELSGGIINYLESSLACIEDPVTFDDVDPATGGLTDTDLGGSVIYQWEVNYNDGGFEDIAGATTEFYTTTETGAGTYIYRRKATDFCGNIAYTNQITITRTTFALLEGGDIVNTGDQLVCPIQAVTFDNLTTPTGGHTDTLLGGSISYQWEVKHDSDEFEEITGATEEHYTTAQLGAGEYVYRRKATDQCGSTAYSNEITITRLEGDILMGGVISYTGPTTLCTPEEVIIFNNVTPATGGVNDAAAPTSLVYQWEVSHNGGVFVAIDGATSEFYTTTETASGTYIYRRKVTDTYCTNSAWTNEITINRSELSPLDGGTINYLESSVACPNASIQFNDITPVTGGLSDPGIGGSVTYQWEVSHNGGAFVAIVGATSEFYTTPIATPLGTYIYRRKATDFCGNIAYTNTITIIREELAPLAPGVITYTGLTIVCFGDIIVFDEVTSASGGLTASEDGGSISYQWEVSMDEGATFTDIVGATSEFYTSNEVGVGTYTYRRKVTDACGSEAWTNNITITRGGKIFTATNGNNWAEANNWNPIGVPSTADCVTIPNGLSVVVDSPALSGTVLVQSGGALTVTASGTLFITDEIYNQSTSSSFLVESGGNLIQENDVVNTGAITVERISNPMDTFNFTYWGAPVNTTLNNIAWYSESAPGMFTVSENSNISTSFTWNANTGSWDISQMPYMGTMEAGIGYLVKAPDSFITSGGKKPVKATFSGIPNNGDISVNIVAGNHNLLSNPYPSAIHIDDFLGDYAGDVTQGTIYLWSNGEPEDILDDEGQPTGGFTYSNADFATYTFMGGTGTGPGVGTGAIPSGFVASGQAFFIVGNTGGTVTFKNEYRYDVNGGYNNTQFFKTMSPSSGNQGIQIEKHRFWLNLTGENTEFKQTLIGYSNLATDGIDFLDGPQYDAGNPTNLYTTIDNTKYAIQAYELPFENTDETPLGYTVATAGTFTITLHAFDGLFDNQDIYIKDNVLNLVHNLKDGAYEFLTDAGTFEDRFSVVYVPQGGLDTNIPAMAQNWIAYLKDGQIQLESLGFDMKEVYVYDMLGREVYAKQNINANQHTLSRVNGNQILIVKVISTDDVSSVKKVQN